MYAAMLLSFFLAAQIPTTRLGGTLYGKVITGPFENPVVSIPVRLEGQTVLTAFTNGLGHFVFHDLQYGVYEAVIDTPGLVELRQRVEIRSFDTFVIITVQSRPAGTERPDSHQVDIRDLVPKQAMRSYERGLKSKSKGNVDEAIRHMREAIRVAPGYFSAHHTLGTLYQQAGSLQEASEEYARARALNPRAVEPVINLGGVSILSGDFEQAVNLLEEAVRMAPRHPKAFLTLGVALYSANRYEKAEKALLRAHELDSTLSDTHSMLAYVYVKIKTYDKAVEQINLFLGENPEDKRRAPAERLRMQLQSLVGRP